MMTTLFPTPELSIHSDEVSGDEDSGETADNLSTARAEIRYNEDFTRRYRKTSITLLF